MTIHTLPSADDPYQNGVIDSLSPKNQQEVAYWVSQQLAQPLVVDGERVTSGSIYEFWRSLEALTITLPANPNPALDPSIQALPDDLREFMVGLLARADERKRAAGQVIEYREQDTLVPALEQEELAAMKSTARSAHAREVLAEHDAQLWPEPEVFPESTDEITNI